MFDELALKLSVMTAIFRPPAIIASLAISLSSLLVPSEAKAFLVTLPDQSQWNISTVSFASGGLGNPNNTITSNILQSQPWWSNQSLAITFSNAVYNQGGNTALGYPLNSNIGPRFAYNVGPLGIIYSNAMTRTNSGLLSTPALTTIFDTSQRYAIASANSNAPVDEIPGPLPVLGAFAAFGWSRRVRKSIRSAKLTKAS